MKRYTSAVTLNVSVFLFMCGVGMTVALLPKCIIDLSGSVSDVAYLASAFAVAYIIFQLPIGGLADRFGFKLFLTGGYFLCGLAGVLYYCAETPQLVFFGRMVQGVGEAPLWALAPAMLSVLFPAAKGKVVGIYNASIHTGLTAGSILGVLLLTIWHGNEAFLLFSGVSFAGGIITLLFLGNPRHIHVKETLSVDYKQLLFLTKSHDNAIVMAGIMLFGAGYGIFLTMIPAFLIHERHVDQTFVGHVFTLFYVSISLSQLIAGPLSDRIGRIQPMICGMVMASFGLAMFSQSLQPWFYILLATASLGLGFFAVSSFAFLSERGSDSLKGTISGAFYVSWGIGFFTGPLLLGKFSQAMSFSVGFYCLAGLFLCEAIALKCSGISHKRDREHTV